jgi:hypothetical protein
MNACCFPTLKLLSAPHMQSAFGAGGGQFVSNNSISAPLCIQPILASLVKNTPCRAQRSVKNSTFVWFLLAVRFEHVPSDFYCVQFRRLARQRLGHVGVEYASVACVSTVVPPGLTGTEMIGASSALLALVRALLLHDILRSRRLRERETRMVILSSSRVSLA